MNLLNKITHLARPGRTKTITDETGTIQTVQAQHTAFEVSNVNSMQLVGLASAMPLGTDIMRLNVGGDNSNGTIIASNHQQYRPKTLATGETMLYDCQATQQSIYLRADGTIIITSKNNVITNCPLTTVNGNAQINGNLMVSGSITATGDVSGGGLTLDTHVHTNGGGIGDSGPPI